MKLILPGIPPSKKNSRIIIHGKNGRHFDIPSNEYQKWEKNMAWEVTQQCRKVGRMKLAVHLHVIFHVIDKVSWDLSNKLESVQDLLKKCSVVSDDNRFVIQEVKVSWMPADSDFTEILLTDASPDSQQLLPLAESIEKA